MKKVVPADCILIPGVAERVFKGIIFDVYQWEQRLFDGADTTFEMLKRVDTANVVCLVDDKILVLDDEQPNSGAHKSFPGGRADKHDENMLATAKREVQEETGYSFKQWRLIKVTQPSKKIEWFVYAFLAWDPDTVTKPHLDGGERIKVSQLPFDEAKALVMGKHGYLGENIEAFEKATCVQDLLALPEYKGQVVDR